MRVAKPISRVNSTSHLQVMCALLYISGDELYCRTGVCLLSAVPAFLRALSSLTCILVYYVLYTLYSIYCICTASRRLPSSDVLMNFKVWISNASRLFQLYFLAFNRAVSIGPLGT